MLVRPANRSDAETIIAFQKVMASESENLTLDPVVLRDGVMAVFEDPSKGSYLVAEEEGVVIGCLLIVPEWSDWRNGSVLWIHSVYVEPQYRRRGVFHAMYRQLQERVHRDPDIKGLRLYVDKGNELGHQVYRTLGMDDTHYALFEWVP